MSHLIPGTGAGQKLSPTQIYQLALQAGFSAVDAVTATAIALAESGGQTNIANDSTNAAGLWQLYTGSNTAQTLEYQQAMTDPLSNARAAYAKFVGSQKARGANCGWYPWASYDEGCAAGEANRNNSWRTYVGMAQAAATGVDIAGGGGSLVVPSGPGASSGGLPDAGVAGVVAQGGGGGTQQLTLANLGPFALKVGSGLLWSLLFIGGALALLAVGVYLVFRRQIDQAVGDAAAVGARAAAVAA